jgi:hypothetical protein
MIGHGAGFVIRFRLEVIAVERMWLRIALTSLLLLLTTYCVCFSQETYELEPGIHELTIMDQHFEVETEVRIELVFDFVDEIRVAGSVTVLDPPWSGYVRLTWLEQGVHVVEEIVKGTESFEYSSSETGHAERKTMPKFPTLPQQRR